MKLISLIFTLILCLPMSRDKRVPVSLNFILERPSTIVVKVKKNNPFSVQREEKITKGLKSVPSFKHFTHHYKVEEVLYANHDVKRIKMGKDIIVHRADYHNYFKLHKMYYLEKVSRSRYIYYYEKEMDIDAVDQAIIYIKYQKEDNIFEYVVQGAYDSIHKKKDILNLLREIKN